MAVVLRAVVLPDINCSGSSSLAALSRSPCDRGHLAAIWDSTANVRDGSAAIPNRAR